MDNGQAPRKSQRLAKKAADAAEKDVNPEEQPSASSSSRAPRQARQERAQEPSSAPGRANIHNAGSPRFECLLSSLRAQKCRKHEIKTQRAPNTEDCVYRNKNCYLQPFPFQRLLRAVKALYKKNWNKCTVSENGHDVKCQELIQQLAQTLNRNNEVRTKGDFQPYEVSISEQAIQEMLNCKSSEDKTLKAESDGGNNVFLKCQATTSEATEPASAARRPAPRRVKLGVDPAAPSGAAQHSPWAATVVITDKGSQDAQSQTHHLVTMPLNGVYTLLRAERLIDREVNGTVASEKTDNKRRGAWKNKLDMYAEVRADHLETSANAELQFWNLLHGPMSRKSRDDLKRIVERARKLTEQRFKKCQQAVEDLRRQVPNDMLLTSQGLKRILDRLGTISHEVSASAAASGPSGHPAGVAPESGQVVASSSSKRSPSEGRKSRSASPQGAAAASGSGQHLGNVAPRSVRSEKRAASSSSKRSPSEGRKRRSASPQGAAAKRHDIGRGAEPPGHTSKHPKAIMYPDDVVPLAHSSPHGHRNNIVAPPMPPPDSDSMLGHSNDVLEMDE